MAVSSIYREVTTTQIEMAKIEMVDGEVKAVSLPPVTKVGNVTKERAQREMKKEFGEVTVTAVTPTTKRYKMPVLQFMELAQEVSADEKEEAETEEK